MYYALRFPPWADSLSELRHSGHLSPMTIKTINRCLLFYFKDLGLVVDVPGAWPGDHRVLGRAICPFHDGADDKNGLRIYADGWVCHKDCHRHSPQLGSNLNGLIRRLVHQATGTVLPWHKAWDYARRNKARFRAMFSEKVGKATGTESTAGVDYDFSHLMTYLDVPATVYLRRRYRSETLIEFGVGTVVGPLPYSFDLSGWTIVPVLSADGKTLVGWTARNPHWAPGKSTKWIHNLVKSKFLFNVHRAARARDHLIITESPGNVMRLYEAGFVGSVATLGGPLGNDQRGHFFIAGGDNSQKRIIIAADNDPDGAGMQHAQNTLRQIEGVCIVKPTIVLPPNGHKDFGDCTPEEARAAIRAALDAPEL